MKPSSSLVLMLAMLGTYYDAQLLDVMLTRAEQQTTRRGGHQITREDWDAAQEEAAAAAEIADGYAGRARVRWGELAISLLDTLDAKLAQFPSVIEAQHFEPHERALTDSLVKRLEIALRRAKELHRTSTSVVDAG
jgi:hypothetical protein